MTLKEAQETLNKINRECMIAGMNRDWARARELNNKAIELQNEINRAMYGQR